MGQSIEVSETIVVDDVLVLDTNRGITGQDGVGYSRGDDLDDSDPARLAGRIFEADESVDHVFTASAQLVVRRPGGWDSSAEDAVAAVVTSFFVFYAG